MTRKGECRYNTENRSLLSQQDKSFSDSERKRTSLERVSSEAHGAHSLVVDEGLVQAVGAEKGVGVRAAPAQQRPLLTSAQRTSRQPPKLHVHDILASKQPS